LGEKLPSSSAVLREVSVDPPENHRHSFIIKIWLEEPATAAAPATWRGHITHVPSQTRRYLKDLPEIMVFVVPYLEEMGISIGPLVQGERHD
jgi:hypothetical protein